LGGPPSARNIKYARMYHFEKNNSKIFSPEARENVWGPSENVSPVPAVALDGPASALNLPLIQITCKMQMTSWDIGL